MVDGVNGVQRFLVAAQCKGEVAVARHVRTVFFSVHLARHEER